MCRACGIPGHWVGDPKCPRRGEGKGKSKRRDKGKGKNFRGRGRQSDSFKGGGGKNHKGKGSRFGMFAVSEDNDSGFGFGYMAVKREIKDEPGDATTTTGTTPDPAHDAATTRTPGYDAPLTLNAGQPPAADPSTITTLPTADPRPTPPDPGWAPPARNADDRRCHHCGRYCPRGGAYPCGIGRCRCRFCLDCHEPSAHTCGRCNFGNGRAGDDHDSVSYEPIIPLFELDPYEAPPPPPAPYAGPAPGSADDASPLAVSLGGCERLNRSRTGSILVNERREPRMTTLDGGDCPRHDVTHAGSNASWSRATCRGCSKVWSEPRRPPTGRTPTNASLSLFRAPPPPAETDDEAAYPRAALSRPDREEAVALAQQVMAAKFTSRREVPFDETCGAVREACQVAIMRRGQRATPPAGPSTGAPGRPKDGEIMDFGKRRNATSRDARRDSGYCAWVKTHYHS